MNSFEVISDYTEYKTAFINENARLNLISKNDEKLLYEKHIYDSLAIKLFFEKYNILHCGLTVLDIGCGGGFPCVPIAIEYPNLKIIGVDSIRKKINAVNEIIQKLSLKNVSLICDRIENLSGKYDVIVSRAVADIAKLADYAAPFMTAGSYFIAYKSKKATEEIISAKAILKKNNMKVEDVIEYTLPLEENYIRNLIIIKKQMV